MAVGPVTLTNVKGATMRTTLVLSAVLLASCATSGGVPVQKMESAKQPYSIQGNYFEGCECASVCPCPFGSDATFEECRGTSVFQVQKGRYGGTDLKGVVFAMVLTHLGKNVSKNAGNWEGILYVSDTASQAQKAAAEDIIRANFGAAFKKLEVKSTPIAVSRAGDVRKVEIQGAVSLELAPLKGRGGAAPMIQNAPGGFIAQVYCAKTQKHTFSGGGVKWDLPDRNAFFGKFHYTSK